MALSVLRRDARSAADPTPPAAAPPGSHRLLRAWLELLTLWGFALVLPVFQILADGPDHLVAQDARWPHLPVVALAFVVVPPTVMVAVEALLRRRPRAASLVHRGFLGLLFAALILQALKDEFDPARRSLFLAALLAGAVFAYLYGRGRFLPTVLTVLSPVPVAALVWFLVLSPVSDIAWPSSDGPQASRTDPTMPVVLVLFDELSTASIAHRGRINRRLPSMTALAATSTWYRNATTVAHSTLEAVPAILTGRAPPEDALPIAKEHAPSLFDRVGGRFHVEEPITDLCTDGCDDGSPVDNGIELTRNLVALVKTRLRRGVSPDAVGLPQETVRDRPGDVTAFADGLVDGLNVLHVELPHVPYQYGPAGKYTESFALPGLTNEHWTADPGPVAAGEGRYLAQLAYTDRLLGRLMRELRRKRLWDRALVIVTADHGVAFVPDQSRRGVGLATVAEIAGVPLFVKAPGQTEGRASAAWVKTIDVLPTIGDHLGADWPSDGQSLRDPRSRPDVRVGSFAVPIPAYELLRERASARLARAWTRPPPSIVTGEG